LRPKGAGSRETRPPLIVAAHYDTVAGSPGANDNASGLAVLLEAARALREHSCSREVRFIAFCLEEEQLLGSRGYVAHLREGGQALCGAIVLECVGYASREPGSQRVPPGIPIAVPSVGDFLAVVGNNASSSLLSAFEQAANRAVPALKTAALLVPGNGEMLRDCRRSDHAAFWDAGYPALMLTDTAEFRSPHYHRPTDRLDTLDPDFLTLVARAVVAGVAAIAE
jgi:Zn-dependent M28 family amino/carboxypeptidase